MHRVNRSATPNEDQMRRMALNLRANTGRGIVWQHVSAWKDVMHINTCYSIFWGTDGQASYYAWSELMDKYFEIMGE